MDLINYTDFDLKQFREDMSNINPEAKIIPISATTDSKICDVIDWLFNEVKGQS
jgi:Ni2+-binding GTPase involved in maturation of urease and hydrogenase